jgi:isopentenyl phosphate kinase
MRLVKEISQANVSRLVLVHGGGSFGHPIAREFRIVEGYKSPSQIMGFSRAREAMIELNKIIVNTLIDEGIPAVTIQPSAIVTTNLGRIQYLTLRNIVKLLELGFTPVLYGDVVLDSTVGFTVLSGDQLASTLAIELNADRIIMGVDVDGLYTDDPKTNPNARLIKNLSLVEIRKIQHSIGVDVIDINKGMRGKILEIIPSVERGIPIAIVNASQPNIIYKALKGEIIGTTIENYLTR